MKTIFSTVCLFLFTNILFAQATYKGLPLIKAQAMTADYRMDNNWTRGEWRISPEAAPDVLSIPCFSRNVAFAFYTDVDSVSFLMNSGKVQQFYVQTPDNRYALTEVRGFNYDAVQFATNKTTPALPFWYEKNKDNKYLDEFRATYHLDDLVKGLTSDSAKALRVLNWVHNQWQHNGMNQPKKRDALSILAEVKEGKNFRCVEYGIVTTAALNALGLPARVLALKTKDVETTESGAGHVLLEVFLKDMNKWVLMDGQWDVMPVLNGVPLNAVEFQQAIANHYDALQIRSLSGESKEAYVKWVYPYLYYFDVKFDNREGYEVNRKTNSGKTSMMLVPVGAKNPTVFQKIAPITYVIYTNSVADFYSSPLQ